MIKKRNRRKDNANVVFSTIHKMFQRNNSNESNSSTTPLITRNNSTTVSFINDNQTFPSTSAENEPNHHNNLSAPFSRVSSTRLSYLRSRLSREHSSQSSTEIEDDDKNNYQPHFDQLKSIRSQSTLSALQEVDETIPSPTSIQPPILTENQYFNEQFSASDANQEKYRATYLPLFSTSVSWEKNRPSFSLDKRQQSTVSETQPTVCSSNNQQIPEEIKQPPPPKSNSATNLRRQTFVRRLSNFGADIVNTATEVAGTKKNKAPKLSDIFKGKQISLDLDSLSFEASSKKVNVEEALNQRIKDITGQLLDRYYQEQMAQQQTEYSTFHEVKELLSKKIGKLAFILICAFLALLTLKDVVDLSVEYSGDPKQSDMNIRFNESMTMPNITFCMSRSQAWSHFKINPNESVEEWNEIIQDSFEQMNTQNLFIKTPWDYRLIMEAYEVVATLNSMERETTPEGAFRSITVFRTKERLTEKRATVKKWIDYIQKINITFEELTQKVGIETIKHSMQRFQRTTYNESLTIKTRFRTSWISMMQFCFQPWFDTDNFYPIEDQGNFFTMVLSHNSEKLNGQQVDCMSVDFHGRPSSLSRFMEGKGRVRDGFIDELCLGMVHEVTVEVKAQYVMLENDEDGTACNTVDAGELTEFDCRSKCRMEMIRRACNCTALTLSYLASKDELHQYPLCDYTKCFVDPQKHNYTDTECSNKCYKDCNQIRYEIDHATKGRSIRPDISTIYLNWGSFEFLTLKQARVWSIPTFIAALGGSIGMWLGLSILSLIHGASYIFYFIRESKKKSKTIPLAQNIFTNPFKAKSPTRPPPPAYDEHTPNHHTTIQVN